ncbi:hypothetical protein, partial [Actinokineospora sp.]|uniref:hypothetical protein n=1 Tax=Actinokineospora sp. TaxID=1872133 RepID=UPI003D6AAC04
RLLATAATESIQVSLHVWHAKSESASLSLQQLCQQAYDILVTGLHPPSVDGGAQPGSVDQPVC